MNFSNATEVLDDLSRNNYISDNDGYESEDDETGEYAHFWKGHVIVYGIRELAGDLHSKELVEIISQDHLHLMKSFNAT
jgi:hypothetical protein